MFIALAIDVAVGWPDWLYQRIGHPVGWIGMAIEAFETRWNRDTLGDGQRRLLGALMVIAVVVGVTAIAGILVFLIPAGWVGAVLTGIIAWPLVAARSLHDHVAAVADPLFTGDVGRAREAVSMIVGRDPAGLDEAAIGRASLESLAENASDGVVAPLFWGALFGLPGIAAYKAINTLDSMVGYRNDRFAAFGWAAARLDDLVNLVPARLTGVMIACVSRVRRTALRSMWRDARSHRSPNAGWPEAAMAGALGVRLSGPRSYGDGVTEDPWLNPVAGDPRPEDIYLGLRLFRRMVLLAAGLLLFLSVV